MIDYHPLPPHHLMQTFAKFAIALLLSISSWIVAPTALAVTPITLSSIGYKDCPPEIAAGAVTSGGATQEAKCFLVTGKAENKSGKAVYDADVYGRIYDADNNNVLPNRGRVGTLDLVVPGISDFEVRINVAADIVTPLQLKKFKASGFTAKIRQ